jgi:peptidoglycan/LPS O-acetylase OafA/YrhL
MCAPDGAGLARHLSETGLLYGCACVAASLILCVPMLRLFEDRVRCGVSRGGCVSAA